MPSTHRLKGGLVRRGHYGRFETVPCQVCGDLFTKKQPHQKYCDIICYEDARKLRKAAQARS